MRKAGHVQVYWGRVQDPLGDCNCVFVGETGKFLRRLKEHQRYVNKKNIDANALAEHVEVHNHKIDWESAAIIEKETNVTTRLFMEIQSTGQRATFPVSTLIHCITS